MLNDQRREVGVAASTFADSPIEASAALGLGLVHFDLHPSRARTVALAATAWGVRIAAVSARDLRHSLHEAAVTCATLGTRILTAPSGTPTQSARADWTSIVSSTARALQIASEFDLYLAIQPKADHVVDSARMARLLLHELASPRLKVAIDPDELSEPLEDALALVSDHVMLAFAGSHRQLDVLDRLRAPLIVRDTRLLEYATAGVLACAA